MKLLYLSCHSILEYDEISLFHEMGIEVFSPGAYLEPRRANDMRPGLGFDYDPDILAQWHKLAAQHLGEDTKDYLTKEFVDNFDIVLVMHMPHWIERNWEAMKHKIVIWRTIGQAISYQEAQLQKYRKEGMKVVRYSPKERLTPGFCGEDAMIRFYKRPEDFGNWNGDTKAVITFAQSMPARGQACNYPFFNFTTQGLPRKLYGPGNEAAGDINQGKVPFETLQQAMRDHRAYFYTGTHPASYTLNFIEAWMTGIPIVGIGPMLGNANWLPDHKLYEVDSLIENGVTGFISDDPNELRNYIIDLALDDTLAKSISEKARKRAIEVFGVDKVRENWSNFFSGLI